MTQHKSARQFSDQMVCSHCGKAWDVNDPEPTECTTTPAPRKRGSKRGATVWINELREKIRDA